MNKEIDLENFKKYTSFFHDGELIKAEHKKNKKNIDLYLNSSEIVDCNEGFDFCIKLSKKNTLSGVLHIHEIDNISLDGKDFDQILIKTHPLGEIFRLDLDVDSVFLTIIWYDFSKNMDVIDCSDLLIKAKNIWWENIPHLGDEW